MRIRPVSTIGTAALAALAMFGCGGGESTPRAASAAEKSQGATGDDGTGTSGPESADCDAVEAAGASVGVFIQLLPQIREPSQVNDTLLLPDTVALRADIDSLRPLANDEATAFLDDLERGVDLIEEGRRGDAQAAVVAIAGLTGGLDGVQDWLFRQVALAESYDAAGC